MSGSKSIRDTPAVCALRHRSGKQADCVCETSRHSADRTVCIGWESTASPSQERVPPSVVLSESVESEETHQDRMDDVQRQRSVVHDHSGWESHHVGLPRRCPGVGVHWRHLGGDAYVVDRTDVRLGTDVDSLQHRCGGSTRGGCGRAGASARATRTPRIRSHDESDRVWHDCRSGQVERLPTSGRGSTEADHAVSWMRSRQKPPHCIWTSWTGQGDVTW